MPLNPTANASGKTALPERGIIGMAINGVPAYGPMEVSDANAVEPGATGEIQDAQFWYGHAASGNIWHVHNPHLGQESPSSSTLLGYALDGFPIYGPLTDTSVLDDCNGITENGVYKYHVRVSSCIYSTSDVAACKSKKSPDELLISFLLFFIVLGNDPGGRKS